METQKRIIDEIMANSTEAIIVTDLNQKITHFNKAAVALTGFNIVEVLNNNVKDFLFLYRETGQINLDEISPTGLIENQGIIFNEKNIKLITKLKDENIVNVRSLKVKGGSEINLGSIIFIQDTFEQADLERTKLDFVSMAEHVLRTPITVIRGNLSRLLDEKTTSKLDEAEVNHLNNTFTGTSELLILIENLMNIVEIRKGDLTLSKSAISIETLILKTVRDFKYIAEEKNLKLVFIPPLNKLPMVDADVAKLKIVLQNLVENAVKYTSEGKIEFFLDVTEDNKIMVSVHDTGKGIPADNINQLFTKFYRVKKALEMEYGMGLGLYMSKKIIEAHGGNIWVESVEGQGSTFKFTIPISEKPSFKDY